jgi:hypothetical protein
MYKYLRTSKVRKTTAYDMIFFAVLTSNRRRSSYRRRGCDAVDYSSLIICLHCNEVSCTGRIYRWVSSKWQILRKSSQSDDTDVDGEEE